VAGNEYLQRAEPWAVYKTDPERAAAIIRFALNLVRLYAILSRPFVPDASAAMLDALKLPQEAANDWPGDVAAALEALPAGHGFEVPGVLFAKITDEARAEMAARFAGAG
jgi:methionyl-tRNA synthetase